MEKNIEVIPVKRPWTIKWSVGIQLSMMTGGIVILAVKERLPSLSIVGTILFCVLIYAVWQGRIWARNIYFFYLLFILPLLVVGIGGIILDPKNNNRLSDFEIISSILVILLFITPIVMMFMKPSREWFVTIQGKPFMERPNEVSWYLQLTVIVFSMGLGALAMSISAMLNLVPLAKEWMLNFSTYYSRLAILLGLENLSFLIGIMVIIVPFGLLIGYWKKGNTVILMRLITMGAIFPVILFAAGKTLFLLSLFFFSKVLIIGVVAYISLCFGERISNYFEKLKQPKIILS